MTTREHIQAELQDLQKALRMIWASTITEMEAGSQPSQLIAKALDSLRDAELCVENPALRQMNCLTVGGDTHAVNDKGHPLCGFQPDFNDTWMPSVRVPTCPLCVKVLAEKEGGYKW